MVAFVLALRRETSDHSEALGRPVVPRLRTTAQTRLMRHREIMVTCCSCWLDQRTKTCAEATCCLIIKYQECTCSVLGHKRAWSTCQYQRQCGYWVMLERSYSILALQVQ
ncbi:hypothetical protein KCV06_g52, partial [Aureobasidium melanogenum]